MANFSNNAITDKGRILLASVQAGAVFTPTRIVMGSGYLPTGTTAATITDVVTPVKSLEINKKERTPDGRVIFGGAYSNADVAVAFYFRELALYAKAVYLDEDGNTESESGEVLYCYGNAGSTADLMAAYATSTVVEKQINLETWVGNNATVNLTIASGVALTMEALKEILVDYAKTEDVETKISNGLVMTDDTTGTKYKWGVENGLVYIEEVS